MVAYFAMTGPIALIGVLAILGRCFVSPWVTPGYSEEENARFLAYQRPVFSVKSQLEEIAQGDPCALDRATQEWIDLAQQGALSTIPPVAADDHGMDGVRGEIESARKTLLFSLQRSLVQAQSEEDIPLQAHRIAQLIGIAEISKYNSPLATCNGSQAQIIAIDGYLHIQDKLKPTDRTHLRRLILSTVCDPDQVLRTATRFASLGHLNPHGTKPHMTTAAFASLVVTNPPAANRMAMSTEGTMLLQSIRVAYESEMRLIAAKQRFAHELVP